MSSFDCRVVVEFKEARYFDPMRIGGKCVNISKNFYEYEDKLPDRAQQVVEDVVQTALDAINNEGNDK